MQFQTIQPSKDQYNNNLLLAPNNVVGFNLSWLNTHSATFKQPWHQH